MTDTSPRNANLWYPLGAQPIHLTIERADLKAVIGFLRTGKDRFPDWPSHFADRLESALLYGREQ